MHANGQKTRGKREQFGNVLGVVWVLGLCAKFWGSDSSGWPQSEPVDGLANRIGSGPGKFWVVPEKWKISLEKLAARVVFSGWFQNVNRQKNSFCERKKVFFLVVFLCFSGVLFSWDETPPKLRRCRVVGVFGPGGSIPRSPETWGGEIRADGSGIILVVVGFVFRFLSVCVRRPHQGWAWLKFLRVSV